MVELLQNDFVNTWVLGKQLEAISQEAASGELRALGRILHENYVYPVDSKVISPDLTTVDTRPAQGTGSERGYVDFLRAALAPQDER